jgi:hypothetical protein
MLFNQKRRMMEWRLSPKINFTVQRNLHNKTSKIRHHKTARTFVLKIPTEATKTNPPGEITTLVTTPTGTR